MGAHTSLNGYTLDANGNSQPSSTFFGLAAADEKPALLTQTRQESMTWLELVKIHYWLGYGMV